MKIIELLPNQFANVEAGNAIIKISTSLLENATVGEYVIVHAGFAIEKLDEEAAAETFALLKELASC